MTEVILNYCLTFAYPRARNGESCQLVWDLRDPPSTAAQLISSSLRQRLTSSFKVLQSQLATTPPVNILYISCELLPWQIIARNRQGVTVRDVLEAIYNVTHAPLTHDEWERLSVKQQDRIKRVFDVRWREAANPEQERKNGVRRVDCLLQVRTFAHPPCA
jgi:hypothetical protein